MQEEKIVKFNHALASKKVARLLHVLMCVAKGNGRKVGTLEIEVYLAEKGINVELRTIQRDLNFLFDAFDLIKKDNCSPQGWYYEKSEDGQLIASLLKEVA